MCEGGETGRDEGRRGLRGYGEFDALENRGLGGIWDAEVLYVRLQSIECGYLNVSSDRGPLEGGDEVGRLVFHVHRGHFGLLQVGHKELGIAHLGKYLPPGRCFDP